MANAEKSSIHSLKVCGNGGWGELDQSGGQEMQSIHRTMQAAVPPLLPEVYFQIHRPLPTPPRFWAREHLV